jgi:hypothetical protein
MKTSEAIVSLLKVEIGGFTTEIMIIHTSALETD